jgi:hypothetical protein
MQEIVGVLNNIDVTCFAWKTIFGPRSKMLNSHHGGWNIASWNFHPDVIHFTSHHAAKSFEIGCFWQSKGKRKLRSASCALVQGIPLFLSLGSQCRQVRWLGRNSFLPYWNGRVSQPSAHSWQWPTNYTAPIEKSSSESERGRQSLPLLCLWSRPECGS